MAFGTGHHETTRLSLVLLEEYLRPGFDVLDVGTGTGILAIAAVKLGAASALGIDNDEWSIENACENIRLNKVHRRVTVRRGDAAKRTKGSFDLIMANIDLPTISSSLRVILRSLKAEGILILSGLLNSDLSRFMDCISHLGIVPLEMLTENEWVAVSLTKLDARRGH
jgi:ribosomal protein L11 methyltransferase